MQKATIREYRQRWNRMLKLYKLETRPERKEEVRKELQRYANALGYDLEEALAEIPQAEAKGLDVERRIKELIKQGSEAQGEQALQSLEQAVELDEQNKALEEAVNFLVVNKKPLPTGN